jgi:hypothetical protein
MKLDELKRLAKEAKVAGWHKMNKAQLQVALDFGAAASDPLVRDSGVTMGDATPPVTTPPDPAEIPAFLRRGITTPEEKAKVDALVQRELYGKDRHYIMPGKPGSSYTGPAPSAKAKRKGSTPTWVFALGMDASDEAVAPVLGKLPKQARQIAEFVRSEGRVDYPKLLERARHFLKTKQEPERIVQYYRGLLIQSGAIKVVYDDPSIPVEEATAREKLGSVAKRVLAQPKNQVPVTH